MARSCARRCARDPSIRRRQVGTAATPRCVCSGVIKWPLGAFFVQDGCTRMICVAGAPVRRHDSPLRRLPPLRGDGAGTHHSVLRRTPRVLGGRDVSTPNTRVRIAHPRNPKEMKCDPAPCALGSDERGKNITKSRLSATDISALATMKNVAKCDT